MKRITESMDTETAMYAILAKAKENNVFECLGNFATKVINLYIKRFGKKDYAMSIPIKEFTDQLLDCVEHLAATDEDGKKLFGVFTDVVEQSYIVGMIDALMISS